MEAPNRSLGARLKVIQVRPSAYDVTTRGALVQVPARSRGLPARTDPSPARFSLLPGLGTLFRRLDLRYLGWGSPFSVPRCFSCRALALLLLASGVNIPFWILLRLHYMAFFFNTFMPGGAGGDIIKAVYVTQHSTQKAEAATMVLIDRVVGLVGLLVMAGGVVLLNYQELQGIALQVARSR